MGSVARTTFHLESELHTELKQTAARLRKSVRSLLEEGARLVLDRYHGQGDRERLERRASEAWARLQRGYGEREGAFSDGIDALVYDLPSAGEPTSWKPSSSTRGRSSRAPAAKTRGTKRPSKRSRG